MRNIVPAPVEAGLQFLREQKMLDGATKLMVPRSTKRAQIESISIARVIMSKLENQSSDRTIRVQPVRERDEFGMLIVIVVPMVDNGSNPVFTDRLPKGGVLFDRFFE